MRRQRGSLDRSNRHEEIVKSLFYFAITIALIVGTLLTLINLGDRLSAGDLDTVTLGRIAADYAVPWVVSSVGYITARRTAVARAD